MLPHALTPSLVCVDRGRNEENKADDTACCSVTPGASSYKKKKKNARSS